MKFQSSTRLSSLDIVETVDMNLSLESASRHCPHRRYGFEIQMFFSLRPPPGGELVGPARPAAGSGWGD